MTSLPPPVICPPAPPSGSQAHPPASLTGGVYGPTRGFDPLFAGSSSAYMTVPPSLHHYSPLIPQAPRRTRPRLGRAVFMAPRAASTPSSRGPAPRTPWAAAAAAASCWGAASTSPATPRTGGGGGRSGGPGRHHDARGGKKGSPLPLPRALKPRPGLLPPLALPPLGTPGLSLYARRSYAHSGYRHELHTYAPRADRPEAAPGRHAAIFLVRFAGRYMKESV